MKCQIRGSNIPKLMKCYPVASTGGCIGTTDIGKLVTKSSEKYGLCVGSSDYQNIVGYTAMVPENSSAGSTKPFYVAPFQVGSEYEMSYSTLYSTNHPTSTSIGCYIGIGATATIAGAKLSMNSIATAPAVTGTTGCPIFRINGYSTNRRMVYVSAPVKVITASTATGLAIVTDI